MLLVGMRNKLKVDAVRYRGKATATKGAAMPTVDKQDRTTPPNSLRRVVRKYKGS